jgi:sugar phosphate permease
MTPPDAPDAETARRRTWQGVTVAALFTGYAGYYVCRTVLSVASVGMMDDPTSGIDAVGYGRVVAVGIYLYAAGKLLNGVFAEYVGGRTVFLAGMLLSAGCVAAFGFATGFAAMLGLWGANRLVQSMGWLGLVRITGRWFTPGRLATVMGVLSLSYLFGAALAQAYLGALVKLGLGWRELFFVAAATLGLLALACSFLVKDSPRDVGLTEPPPPPQNVYGADDHGEGRVSLGKLLGPLLSSLAT